MRTTMNQPGQTEFSKWRLPPFSKQCLATNFCRQNFCMFKEKESRRVSISRNPIESVLIRYLALYLLLTLFLIFSLIFQATQMMPGQMKCN